MECSQGQTSGATDHIIQGSACSGKNNNNNTVAGAATRDSNMAQRVGCSSPCRSPTPGGYGQQAGAGRSNNNKVTGGGGSGGRRQQLQQQAAAAAATGGGGPLQLWKPSANLSIDTVNRLPHKVKRYYQDILGWGEALPGYAAAALQMGGAQYVRLLQEYRDTQAQAKLWQAAYIKAFCTNLRTFMRDYNRWMLQHWPQAIEEIFLYPSSDATFQHLKETLRYMNDFSVPIREAVYIFKKIQHAW